MPGVTGPAAGRWSVHPWRARAVRLTVYALPVVLSLAFVHLGTSVVAAPTASLWLFLVWWLAMSVGATVVVSVVYAFTRRLLPLGALLELSLVFPDRAPSRFALALQTGTVDSLEERMRLVGTAKEAATPQEAAEILLRLVAELSVHDSITRGHAERVRAYSSLLGTELGLTSEELDRLNWAALLHDIGKLEVSPEILNKAGRPTEEEWESLRRHPLLGETLVEPMREWLGEWADAVGHHHERWDGHGYPRGVAGEEIPRAGRIVAIADAFDVITSSRSYKEPATAAEGRAELVRGAGTQFDASYVRAFVGISLSRMRLVVGPLSWLTHAPLLARIPLTSSVGAAASGVAAVVAATTTALAGAPDAPSATVRPSVPVRETPAPAAAPETTAYVPSGPPDRRSPIRTPSRGEEDGARPKASPVPEGEDGPTETSDPTSPTTPEAPSPGGGAQESPEPGFSPPPPQGAPPPPTSSPPPSPPPASPPPPSTPPPPPPPPPNQPPSFMASGDRTVLEDAGPQSGGWASAISSGPASESSQTVSFETSTSNPGLFAAGPSVAADGTLTFMPAADAYGSATVTVTARDNGGTANGGDDSTSASLTVTILPVNDAPRFSAGGNQTVVSLLGAQSVPGWASGISPGPANESSQTVSFVVTTDKPNLFTVQPAVSPDGTLTYKPRLLGLGVATVTVRAVDSGGTANGGVDTSPPQTFTITVV